MDAQDAPAADAVTSADAAVEAEGDGSSTPGVEGKHAAPVGPAPSEGAANNDGSDK